MYDLENKWVFITGAGSGIGYETCLAFAKQGSHVIATDINLENLNRVISEIEKYNVRAQGYILDVSDEKSVNKLADLILAHHGCPDIVVNNAGILYMADILRNDKAIWQHTMNVNVMGTVFVTQAFIKQMQSEAPAPKFVVNVASQASRTPYVYMSAYAASKYAVEGFTDALRTELALKGSNVIPISVHPGVINTNVIPSKGLGIPKSSMDNLQHKYNTKGSHPSVVANDIVKAVAQKKSQIWSGNMATFGFWADKLLPKKWVAKVVAKDAQNHGFVIDAE